MPKCSSLSFEYGTTEMSFSSFFAMVVSEKLQNSTKYEEQFYDKIPDWIIDS